MLCLNFKIKRNFKKIVSAKHLSTKSDDMYFPEFSLNRKEPQICQVLLLDLISAESAQANLGTFRPLCSAVVLKPPLAIQSVLWIYDGGWRTDLGDKSDFLSPKNPIISFKKSNHIILENNEKTGVPFSTIIIVKSCFIPISYDDILMLKTSASGQCQVFSGTLIW